MVLTLSVTAAYLIVFLSLLGFALLAVFGTGWSLSRVLYPKEDYLSARSSQGWFTLGLSLYASAVGSWVLYQPPYVGATGAWVPVFAYALCSILAMALVAFLGPYVRRLMPPNHGFTSADYLRQRFGRAPEYCTALLSLLVMTISLVVEFTCISATFNILTGGEYPRLAAIIPVAAVTLLYTAYAGLPASIWTDKFQGLLLIGVLCVVLPASLSHASLTGKQWAHAAMWTDSNSWWCSASLILSVSFCEIVNQGSWQRVYAARSSAGLTKAYGFAMLLVFPSIFLLGVTGIATRAKFPDQLDSQDFLNGTFFHLLLGMSHAWQGLVGVLAMCLAASSVDTLQSGLAALIGECLSSRSLSMNWARLFTVLVNSPAVLLAVQGLDILQLFMVSNTLTLAVGPPALLSLWHRITNKGTIAGYVCGTCSILIYGWAVTGRFVSGLKFCYQQPLDTPEYVGLLLTVILSSTMFCVLASLLDGHWNPELWEKELARRTLLQHQAKTLACVSASSTIACVINETHDEEKGVPCKHGSWCRAATTEEGGSNFGRAESGDGNTRDMEERRCEEPLASDVRSSSAPRYSVSVGTDAVLPLQ